MAGRKTNERELCPPVDLPNQLAASLNTLWQQEELCDVQVVAGDGEVVPAHKVVLASSSPFFKALLAGTGLGMREGPALAGGRLEVAGVDGDSLREVVGAVYSQRLSVSAHNVHRLLAASGYLAVKPVRTACCRYLHSHLTLATCVETLLLAFQFDCDDLFEQTMRFLETHFPELMGSSAHDNCSDLQLLPLSLISRLLASDGLSAPSELDVARAAAVWLAADPDGRAADVGALLQCVRLPPSTVLHQMGSDPLWRQLPRDVAAATEQAFLHACAAAARRAATTPGEQLASEGARAASAELVGAFRPRQSTPTQLLVVGGVDEGWRSLKTVEVYDPAKDCWAPGPAMPAACSFPAGASVGGSALVVEGAAHTAAVLAFDREKRVWAHRPPMITPRVNLAAAGLPGLLVAMGGRAGRAKDSHVLRDAEALSLVDDKATWRPLPPMSTPRCALGAAALGGAVYAVGGQSDRATHATAECFAPSRGEWVPVGPALKEGRKYLAAPALGGRVYAVGGMTHARRRLASVEALDPREGRWHQLAPMSVARSSCGAAVLGEELYVVGGSITAENQSHEGVECFCPRAGRWRGCAPIGHGRSGLTVLPV